MDIPTLNDILHHYPEFAGVHPACLAVPAIDEEDLTNLRADIRAKGLSDDIEITPDRLLLDGRSRLIACYLERQEIRVKVVQTDPWQYSYTKNVARRHLTVGQKAVFADAWAEVEETAAKERKVESGKAHGRGPKIDGGNLATTYSTSNVDPVGSAKPQEPKPTSGKARDRIGERVGIGGRSVQKMKTIKQFAPELIDRISDGSLSLEKAYSEASKRRKQQKSLPVPTGKPKSPTSKDAKPKETAQIITVSGKTKQIAKPKRVVFNKTNSSVDWAGWTWNPVTGCNHGCSFCYAREIAHSGRMVDYYPFKFEPTLHEYRLDAPSNTKIPGDGTEQDGRVFVCSMADLFGKWVPDEWIKKVFDACLKAPEWEYLFLTKWPKRYLQMPLLPKAWYGASVVQQSDVERVEKAMKDFNTDTAIKWISLEPMTEAIKFNDLSWCNLVVIGSQTSTTQPEGFVPAKQAHFDWVWDVVDQCREASVPYYLKDNLGPDAPGMKLPKMSPSRFQRIAF